MQRMKELTVSLAALFTLGAAGSVDSTNVSGLKEALRIATERAVRATSETNGFLDNAKIRIGLPGSLGKMASGLRAIGMLIMSHI